MEPFTTNSWTWDADNVVRLGRELSDEDRELFSFDISGLDWPEYLQTYVLGIRKFLFKVIHFLQIQSYSLLLTDACLGGPWNARGEQEKDDDIALAGLHCQGPHPHPGSLPRVLDLLVTVVIRNFYNC